MLSTRTQTLGERKSLLLIFDEVVEERIHHSGSTNEQFKAYKAQTLEHKWRRLRCVETGSGRRHDNQRGGARHMWFGRRVRTSIGSYVGILIWMTGRCSRQGDRTRQPQEHEQGGESAQPHCQVVNPLRDNS